MAFYSRLQNMMKYSPVSLCTHLSHRYGCGLIPSAYNYYLGQSCIFIFSTLDLISPVDKSGCVEDDLNLPNPSLLFWSGHGHICRVNTSIITLETAHLIETANLTIIRRLLISLPCATSHCSSVHKWLFHFQ